MNRTLRTLLLLIVLIVGCVPGLETPASVATSARPAGRATTPRPSGVTLQPTRVISPTPSPSSTSAATPGTTQVPGIVAPSTQFDQSRAFEHNRVLAVEIGKRVAGSEGGARAADYIAQAFARFGYRVERQPFSFEAWEDRGTQARVTTPESFVLEVQPIQYSPAGQVESDVVLVGGVGETADFEKVDVKGKIALVQRGVIPFSDKGRNGASAGAAAVLIYNNTPGLFGGTMRERVTIPVIAVEGEGGQRLAELVKKGNAKVNIASDTLVAEKTGHNIIGTRAGTTGEVIILGGHYDSVEVSPGAVDNGSGTAVLLELARVLALKQHGATLRIIAFDAEEFGLIGSRYYTDHLTESERRQIRAMLNFDMLGGGSGPLLLSGEGTVALTARSSAQELGIQVNKFTLPAGAGSDHFSFERFNIDNVFFFRDYNLLHTQRDAIGEVRAEYLGEAGRVAERLVDKLDATQ